MNSEELLKSVTQTFFKSQNHKITYLSLSEELMKFYKSSLDSDVIFIDIEQITTPLKPFIEVLRITPPTFEQVKKYAYELQKTTFHSYFDKGTSVERRDILIPEEIFYEKTRYQQTILSLMEELVEGKYVIYNAQILSKESLEILKNLENYYIEGKFIFCFNSMQVEDSPDYIKDFIQVATDNGDYFPINSDTDFTDVVQAKKENTVDNYSFESIYEELREVRIFLDLSEASRLIKKIESLNILNNFEQEQKRQIFTEFGLICYYHGEYDLSSYYFNNVEENEIDDLLSHTANYYLACVSYSKNMYSVALRYINKCKQLLKDNEDSDLYVYTHMMEYIITERIDETYSVQKYTDSIELLKRKGFINNASYTSLIIPWTVVYQANMRRLILERVKTAKAIAEKIGNKFGLSMACHWLGIINTHEGRKDESLKWYNKCLALREEMGEILAIIKITNGISYEYLISSKYSDCYNMMNGFINHLMESDDYPEIIITLCNIARVLFYSRNLDAAYEVLQKILNLIYIFDIQEVSYNSFLPEYNDILIYKAIIDFFKGETTKAKMYLHNISTNGKYFTHIEEILKYFLKACIEVDEKNLKQAIDIFEQGEWIFKKIGKTQEHRLVFMYYEFALILQKNGYNKESNLYCSKGFELAKENNFTYFTCGKKSDFSIYDYLENVKHFPPLNIDLNALEERAEKERLVNQLHEQLRSSQFLNKLMLFSHDNFDEKKYLNNAVQAVFDFTMADAVFIAEKKDDNWSISSSALRYEITEPDTSFWEEIISDKEHASATIIKKAEKDYQLIYTNLSKFEFTGAAVIYLQKKFQLSTEEKNALNLAIFNIQAQLVMFKQNQHLSMISLTDQLSKLKNRRALQEHIEIENEMLSRYDMFESVAFIDLDNFKYYNDTFGHDAGDLLIAQIGRLLNEVFRKVDFVARFGGDEFVVILPNTTCEDVKKIGMRLKEYLQREDYYIPQLKKLLKKDIEIPQQCRLGFSMGISSTKDCEPSTLEATMTNADHALYYSKQTQKGSISIWSEIKDKVNVNEAKKAMQCDPSQEKK